MPHTRLSADCDRLGEQAGVVVEDGERTVKGGTFRRPGVEVDLLNRVRNPFALA
jgi:hypothetical protein